jgi:hypothetical protein
MTNTKTILLIAFSCIITGAIAFILGSQSRPSFPSTINQKLSNQVQSLGAYTAIDDEDGTKIICNSILDKVVQNDIDGAFIELAKYSPLPRNELDDLKDQTIRQLNAVRPRFGKYLGHELIKTESSGTSIKRYTYIVKCENHILRWRFIFYKPSTKWFINTFNWDDNIRD